MSSSFLQETIQNEGDLGLKKTKLFFDSTFCQLVDNNKTVVTCTNGRSV